MTGGGVPPGWAEATIGDVVDRLQYGLTASADRSQRGPRFLRITDLEAGRVDWSTVPGCDLSNADLDHYRLVSDDIVFARTGSIEKAARIVNPPEAVFASYLIRGRLVVRDIAGWLGLFVGSYSYVNQVKGLSAGIGRANVNAKNLAKVQIALPPVSEQERIVEIVDSYLTRLDDAVASLERVQAKLKAYRASVLKAAVEGRLVPTEASLARAQKRAYEPAEVLLARLLKERRRRWEEAELAKLKAGGKTPKGDKWKAKYEDPVAPDTSTLPELPEGWCWTSLSALIVAGPQNGIYVPKSQYGEGTPILRIDDYQVDWSKSASELQRVKLPVEDEARFGLSVGDLVLNRVNSPSHLGKTLAVESRHLPAVFESNMMRFTPSSALSPRFLHFYLSSAQGKQRLTVGAKWAVNQASINQQDVGNTAAPLPPESEQIRLVAEIERLLSAATVMAATVEQDAKRSVRLRQAVLKWAFEGKLVDQDPTDEPAERLLARIRAERSADAPTKMSGGRRAKGAA